QVAVLEQWVKMGAPDPRVATTTSAAPAPISVSLEEGKKFWSYQPVRDPAIPAVRSPAWPANPVDYFILSKLEEKSLSPAPPVNKRSLIRRATFDLTGLPPTPEEVESFVADTGEVDRKSTRLNSSHS